MIRVNELLKREIGTIIERTISHDLNCLVTVIEVNTSPDLRQASVYVSVYGGKDQHQKALKSIREKRVDIQNTLSKTVRLKYTPVLHFHLDDQFEKADKICKILDNLKLENDNGTSRSEK